MGGKGEREGGRAVENDIGERGPPTCLVHYCSLQVGWKSKSKYC